MRTERAATIGETPAALGCFQGDRGVVSSSSYPSEIALRGEVERDEVKRDFATGSRGRPDHGDDRIMGTTGSWGRPDHGES